MYEFNYRRAGSVEEAVEMLAAADEMEFERAGVLRDQIQQLEKELSSPSKVKGLLSPLTRENTRK